MKTLVTYRKVGMRYAILMLLGMALMIVAKPQSALAITPCQQACLTSFQHCNSLCHGFGACTTACGNQFTACRAQCS
jgi:hypothetical protein